MYRSPSLLLSPNNNLIDKDYLLGVNTDFCFIQILDNNEDDLHDHDSIIYACGNYVLMYRRHTKQQVFLHQPTSCLEKIRQISLCHQRRFMSIVLQGGKDGYCVVIYDLLSLLSSTNTSSTYRKKKVLTHSNKSIINAIYATVSKDGKSCLLLSDAPTYTLSLWNIERTPEVLATIELKTPSNKSIHRIDFSPTDKKIICAMGDGILRFFRIVDNTFRPITILTERQHQNYTHHCWSAETGDLILCTDTNELIAVNNFEARLFLSLSDWKNSLRTIISFSKGIIIGDDNGSIRVYCAIPPGGRQSFTLTKELCTHSNLDKSGIKVLALSLDEKYLISLHTSGRLCGFRMTNFVDIIPYEEDQEYCIVPSFHSPSPAGIQSITCIDICEWKPIVAIAGSDNVLRLWDYEEKCFQLTCQLQDEIVSISLHPSSLLILVCCKDYCELSSIHSGRLCSIWTQEVGTHGSSCFSNGGQYFALDDGPYAQIFNTYNQTQVCTLQGHSSTIRCISWKADDSQIGTVGEDGVIYIWDSSSGKKMKQHSK